MSAPDTNVETEEKRHRPSLRILWAVLAVVAALFVGYLALAVNPADDAAQEGAAVVAD